MSLFAAQLMASAEVCAEALRCVKVASDLTQADIVERSEGTTGVDQFVLIERGKWPLLSKPCTAIAKAMDLTAAGQAQLLLLALIGGALERRKPVPPSASTGLRLQAFEAFLTAYPQASSISWLRRGIPMRRFGLRSRRGERTPRPHDGQRQRCPPPHH